MGQTVSMGCNSGEKSSKAQRKEERYTKSKPEDAEVKPAENGTAEQEEPETATENGTQKEGEKATDDGEAPVAEVQTAAEGKTEEAAETPKTDEVKSEEPAASASTDVELKIEEPSDKPAEAAEKKDSPVEETKPAEVSDDHKLSVSFSDAVLSHFSSANQSMSAPSLTCQLSTQVNELDNSTAAASTESAPAARLDLVEVPASNDSENTASSETPQENGLINGIEHTEQRPVTEDKPDLIISKTEDKPAAADTDDKPAEQAAAE